MEYPKDIDTECIGICDTLNSLPGISTFSSCCGHGENKFAVHFYCKELDSLANLTRACCDSEWRIFCDWLSGNGALCFTLEGPVSANADDLIPYIQKPELRA